MSIPRTSLIIGGIVVSLVVAEVVLFQGPGWRSLEGEVQKTWLGSFLPWSAGRILRRAECPCPCSVGL